MQQHASPQRQAQARTQPPHSGDDDRGRNAWSGGRNGKGGERDGSVDTIGGQARTNGDGDKKGAKSLAHVPCKFHKQGSCTAGKACPFSHDLTVPGTTKPVCQWYAKGSCKFGHKCALAHILPGQPMSYDRKNKRAAQAALREAQGGQDPNQPPTSPGREQQPQFPGQRQSGIGRSLRNSVDAGARPPPSSPPTVAVALPNGWARAAGSTAAAVPRVAGASSASPATSAPSFSPPIAAALPPVSQVEEFTPSDSDARGRSPPSHPTSTAPPPPSAPAPHPSTSNDPPPRPSPSTLPPVFNPAPSGLSQTLQFGSNGRSSVAAQVMLSQQSRRLSNNGASLSPPRLNPPAQPSRRAFTPGELANATPPLAVPSAIPTNGGSGSSIFGTSPFSGSRALFMPSSYDSNDDNFARSPPGRGGLEEMRRTNSGWDGRGGMYGAEEEDALEDEDEDDYEEGFLPSSLNDLLTPEEQRRRASRMASFDPFLNSRSVPADLTLSHPSPNAWGTMPIPASPPPITRSLLSVTHSFGSPQLARQYHPSSYDPRTQPHPLLPAPGSLPGGLAAGLSTLHLIPATHTGETPPISFGFFAAPPPQPYPHPQLSYAPPPQPISYAPPPAPTVAQSPPTRNAWGTPMNWTGAGAGQKGRKGVASPLGVEKRAGYDDEIQFDMD